MFRPGIDRIAYGGAMIGLREYFAIAKVIFSQGGKRWTVGPESVAFEKELAQVAGVKHATVVNSGSSALLVALAALKLPKGSKVIIPACNFPTAFNAIIQNNLTPVVVDIDLKTLLVDLKQVEYAVKCYPEVKAVIAVNIAGNTVDLPALRKIMGKRKIVLDNCLAEGTLIKTDNGDVPIEKIEVGDRVLTRKGYKKVLRVIPRGQKDVITRFGVTATPDHPFRTTKGNKVFSELQPSDILYLCREQESFTTETNIIDTQSQKTGTKGHIGIVRVKGMDIYTATCGKIETDQYLRDTLFTTEMEIHSIIKSKTLKQSLQSSILSYISEKMGDWKQRIQTLMQLESKLQNGTSLKLEGNGTVDKVWLDGKLVKNTKKNVLSAIKNISHTGKLNQSIVQEGAKHRVRVYDLEVEDAHEFFANGLLVKNCDGFGTTLNGQYVESLADVACVSFHAAHIITTGEGGAVLTNDEELGQRATKLREWGRASGTDRIYKYPGFPDDYKERYVYEEIGWNMKPLELQCAMGRVQLRRIESFKEARRQNYYKLFNIFHDLLKFQTITRIPHSEICWFSFPLLVKENRGKVMAEFERNNIECRTIFSGNILRHPAYKNTEHIRVGKLPNSDIVMRDGMFLSCHPSLTDEMIQFIGKVAKDI